MKQLYLFALAAALSFTTTAQRSTMISDILPVKNKIAEEIFLPEAASMKAASKAISIDDLAGDYTLTSTKLLKGMEDGETPVTITVTGENTLALTLTEFQSAFINVLPATVDLTTGTIAIANKINLGTDVYGDPVYFYLKDNNGSSVVAGASNIGATVGTFSNGSIVFPEMDVWAIGDYNNEDNGLWWMSYTNKLIPDTAEPELGSYWKSAGKATFIDAWCIPGLLNEKSGNLFDTYRFPWTVNVDQDKNNPCRFRVVNPYIAPECPVTQGNNPGYIVFNIEDPTFVIVETGVYSGLNEHADQLNLFNLEGYFIAQGYTKQQILAAYRWSPEECSNYSDGRVFINHARFNVVGGANDAYAWNVNTSDGNKINCADVMKGEIRFDQIPSSGIEAVTVDSNAPAEYFNLQGIRVDNPENGIFIRRQGNEAIKVRF